MPWCPICKNEYREGFTHCKDCDMELVESLDQGPIKIMYGMKEQIEQFADYLHEKGYADAFVRFNPDEKSHDLYVPGEKIEEAKNAIRELISLQTKEREEEMMEIARQQYQAELGEECEYSKEELQEMMRQKVSQTVTRPRKRQAKEETVFIDKKHRAGEYKSSAYSLILVGIAGIILLVLIYMGVLPVHFSGAAKIMITAVMGGLFAGFLIMGFVSFGTYKKYLVSANEQAALMDEINAYLLEHASREKLDAMVKEKNMQLQNAGEGSIDEEDEASAYYMRMRMIKAILNEKYADADTLLVDHLAEEWYGRVYE